MTSVIEKLEKMNKYNPKTENQWYGANDILSKQL